MIRTNTYLTENKLDRSEGPRIEAVSELMAHAICVTEYPEYQVIGKLEKEIDIPDININNIIKKN